MKLALYSAIYGTYEATAKPIPPDLGIPAIMFTDQESIAVQCERRNDWTAIYDTTVYERFEADPANGDPAITVPMLAHKYWKTHPVEAMVKAGLDVDASIWVDGNMRITMPGAEWVAKNVAALGDDDWSLMGHPWRGCVYDEHAYTAAVCWGRYSVEAMQRQIEAIEHSGHPRGWGLFATGHMVRRHTNAVIATSNVWWDHNVKYSHQDQLSLPPLVRLASEPDVGLRWNMNLPWGTWELEAHGY